MRDGIYRAIGERDALFEAMVEESGAYSDE